MGFISSTGDLEGEIKSLKIQNFPTLKEVQKVINTFLGPQEQLPPMFSALKFKGKPLYEYARKGENIDRKKRKINIVSLKVKEYKDNIIENISFNFEQNINGNIENGNCTIEYPKKIFCEYARSNNKILVSNGKSLVIKTISSYYRYPLEKTPLNVILDKNILINKIKSLKERTIDNNLINFTILENNNEINIFFNGYVFSCDSIIHLD